MTSGHVISDLHLFAQRSVAELNLRDIRSAAARSDFFVFNGDIFDFRWSTLPTINDALDAAGDLLRTLVADHPGCRFFYTLGNHDCYEPFIEHLDGLAADTPNFQWHPSHLRLGTVLFLHGDLPLAPPGTERTLHPTLGRNGRTLRMLYRFFIAGRGHRLLAALHQPRACAKRITQWLETNPNGLSEGLTDVYFGHTHYPFSDFEYEGLRFHNTGSSIRGLRSRMLEVRTPAALNASP